MVKSFSVITGLALAVLAQGAYVPEPEYVPVYEATTTPCTTETSSEYPVPTGYGEIPVPVYGDSTTEYPSYPTTTVEAGYPVSSSTECEEAEVTPYTTYTAVYTSCESYPTVYTSEGSLCTTDYSTTHYLTTTLCETTPIETPCPTTITKSYETTYSSCVTYPTTCETSGTTYATDTYTTEYSTSTVCTTEVYTPVPSSYYTEVPVASYPAVSSYPAASYPYTPSVGTAYPQPTYAANHTSYAAAPTYPVSTGGASSLAPSLAAFAAVFGGIVAALF